MTKKWSLFFTVSIAVFFNACGGDSTSSAEDISSSSGPTKEEISARCNTNFGIAETDPWTSELFGNEFLANHICDELNKYMSVMLSFDARCISTDYNKDKDCYDIEIITEQRKMHIQALVSNCTYKMESDGDLASMVANMSEQKLDECICKVENSETYYRNVEKKVSKEKSSSSSTDNASESSNSSSSKNSSSSIHSSSLHESSSSEESSSSVWTPTVLPEGKYSCKKYNCVPTDYLNPEIEYGELLDTREDKVYRTVKIGEQVWMAQNLDYRYVLSETDSNSYCYNDSLDYCKKYGRLYTWAAAIDSVAIEKEKNDTCGFLALCNFTEDEKLKGICPEGFRIPNKTDWITLLDLANTGIIEDHEKYTYYGGAALKLRSKETWQNKARIISDEFGFSMLASGLQYNGDFLGKDSVSSFWSLEESIKSGPYAGYSAYNIRSDEMIGSSIIWHATEKSSALPIRCIKE